MAFQQSSQLFEDRAKPLRKRNGRGQFDPTESQATEMIAIVHLDDPIAGAFGAAINPQNAHLAVSLLEGVQLQPIRFVAGFTSETREAEVRRQISDLRKKFRLEYQDLNLN